MAVADRIVQVLAEAPDLNDDQIADSLGIRRQQVNQECRRLVASGTLHRFAGADGKIVNRLVGGSAPPPPSPSPSVRPAGSSEFISEDEVKSAVKAYLEERGYEVLVAWGRTPGIDIEATGPAGRFLIEAKGEVASQPQKTNYFLGALGELLQRMSDEQATYGLALPDNRTYRGLVQRLPELAKRRLGLRVLFVRRSGADLLVEEEGR